MILKFHLQCVSWEKFRKNFYFILNYLYVLFGVSSLAWAGHLIHVAIPESRGQHVGWDNFLSSSPHPLGLAPFLLDA